MSLIVFIVWLFVVTALAVLPTWATFAYLDDLGAFAPGLGFNATNLQNAIIITCVGFAAILLARALWVRLGWQIGITRIIFILALFGGTAIALLNGPLFLRPVLPIPRDIGEYALIGCMIVTAAGVALALVRSDVTSQQDDHDV